MDQLVIYTRPGCHLCTDMKAVVERVARAIGEPLRVTEIDISADPALEERYGSEIPVLTVNGKKVAKYRVGEGELLRMLKQRALSE